MSSNPRSGSTLTHYVSQAPFDPYAIDSVSPALEKIYMASQWRMMWLRFRRHKVAVAAGLVLALMYLAILIVEFLAPYGAACAQCRLHLCAAAGSALGASGRVHRAFCLCAGLQARHGICSASIPRT